MQEIVCEKFFDYILLISQTDHKVMVSKFGIIFHNMPQDRLFTDLDHWLWF